jgi:hypothetical protein
MAEENGEEQQAGSEASSLPFMMPGMIVQHRTPQDQLEGQPLGFCNNCVVQFKLAEAQGFGGNEPPPVYPAVTLVASAAVMPVPGMPGPAAAIITVPTCYHCINLQQGVPGAGLIQARGEIPAGFRPGG